MTGRFYTLENKFIGSGYFYEFPKFTGIVTHSYCKEWYANGKRHRIEGPAVIYDNGDKYWYFEGKLHRLDGPACEGIDEPIEYFVFGKKCSSKEHHKLLTDMMKLKGLI